MNCKKSFSDNYKYLSVNCWMEIREIRSGCYQTLQPIVHSESLISVLPPAAEPDTPQGTFYLQVLACSLKWAEKCFLLPYFHQVEKVCLKHKSAALVSRKAKPFPRCQTSAADTAIWECINPTLITLMDLMCWTLQNNLCSSQLTFSLAGELLTIALLLWLPRDFNSHNCAVFWLDYVFFFLETSQSTHDWSGSV